MSARDFDREIPIAVVDAWSIDPASVARVASGHINETYRARLGDARDCIVQRVNPIFPAVVNEDIEAVSRHLIARGEISPVIVPTPTGARWLEADGGVWRVLSFIAGTGTETLTSAAEAGAAGALLGRFHAALADLEWTFRSVRSDPHDTPRHLAALATAIDAHGGHRRFEAIAPVAARILDAADGLTPLPTAPLRVVHGDPKISNLLFDPDTGAGLCLVDLDTLGRRCIATELGDAFRSWCNPAGEDAAHAAFSVELFAAAMGGYDEGSRGLLGPDERAAIPAAIETIAVELAARFCADALNERFFGWDRSRFDDASAHNLARARAQLAVAESVRDARGTIAAIVTRP